MITRLILASALALAATSAALAADAPKSTAECMEQAFALAGTAQEKKLSDDKAGQVDELLAKMEDACTSEKFADAAKAADEINAAIGK
ncbi:MAG: hypothetical protein KJ622_00575 [Alphaproteobacteria bacterium]|nr:hypothetical protein [Alphaproteobacteria bacterium]